MSETDLASILDPNGFLNFKIIINVSRDDEINDKLFFNFSLYSINIEDLITNKYPIPNKNCFYIICNSCDKREKLEASLTSFKRICNDITDFENILIVLTKPDRLENFKDLDGLVHSSEYLKYIKFCFIKMKNFEERHTKLSDYTKLEDKYYTETFLVKNDNYFKLCGFNNVVEFVLNNFIIMSKNNLKANSRITMTFLNSEVSELVELGSDIPLEKSKKISYLRNKMKLILNHFQKLNDLYSTILKSIIKSNIYQIEEENNYKAFFISNELNTCVNFDLNKFTEANEFKENLKYKLTLNKKGITFTKKELEKMFFSFSKKIIQNELININEIFERNIQINLDSIFNKINTILKHINEEFREKLILTFQNFIQKSFEEMKIILTKITEIDLNSDLLNDKMYFNYFNEFYNNTLIKNNFEYGNDYENFAINCIYTISKGKLNSLIETFCKIYSYHFYDQLFNQFQNISIEELIKFDENLNLFFEDLTLKSQRVNTIEIITNLFKLIEQLIKLESLTENLNSNSSISGINLSSPLLKVSSNIVNITELKNLKSKFEKVLNEEVCEFLANEDEINIEDFEENIHIDYNELHNLNIESFKKINLGDLAD